MNKQSVINFFDRLAPEWDANMIRDDKIISYILDCGGVKKDVRVLDVACGTGVLIPDYLARDIAKVIGIDISEAMIEIAKSKFTDPRVALINGDIEMIHLQEHFDCCIVYNAFPHFADPVTLIKILSEKLVHSGRLTIAHGMSRAKINEHHSGSANAVSIGLICETELAAIMKPYFDVDIIISNDELYVVSGEKQ